MKAPFSSALTWAAALAAAVVVGVAVLLLRLPNSQTTAEARRAQRDVFPCVRIVSAYAALAERPLARKAILIGDGSEPFRGLLERAGVDVVGPDGGPVDLVFAAGVRDAADDRAAHSALSPDGAWAELVDVKDMKAASFWRILRDMRFDVVHLWMPGERDWLVVGRGAVRPKLSDMMDLFSRDNAISDLSAARCHSLPCAFASYVGSREDVMPAFNGSNAEVSPGNFVTRSPPALSWIDDADVDEDIRSAAVKEIRSLQIVRRMVLVGAMQAAEGEEEKSTETWAKAALENPGDTMLVERLERLAVNAKAFAGMGKPAMAARCWETMAQILPDDPSPVRGYADCMRLMGKPEISELALKRVRELEKRKKEVVR